MGTSRDGSAGHSGRVAVRRLAALSVAVVVFVPGSTLASGTAAPVAAPRAEPGGTLTYLSSADPTIYNPSLDPARMVGPKAYAAGDAVYGFAIYDSLVYEDFATGRVVPRLARSFASSDGLVWTITLRPNVVFSDGTRLNADAVKFNWERLGDINSTSPNRLDGAAISALRVVDPLTLEVTLKQVDALFPRTVAQGLAFIGSPAALRADPIPGISPTDPTAYTAPPIGAGPFIVKEYVPGDHLTLDRNPNYWDKPRPYLEHLVIRFIPDDTARLAALEGGQGQLGVTDRAGRQIAAAKSAGLTVVSGPVQGQSVLAFDVTQAPFDDPIARRAINVALDRKTVTAGALGGAAEVPLTMFPKGTPFYIPTLKLPQYDQRRAQKLLDAYAQAHGGPLTFTIGTTASNEALMNAYAASLAGFRNLTVTTQVLTFAISNLDPIRNLGATGLGRAQVDAFVYAFTAGDPDRGIDNLLQSTGIFNFMRYSSPVVDAALASGRSSLLAQARVKAHKKVQQQFLKDLPLAILQDDHPHLLSNGHVEGVSFVTNGLPMWSNLWLTVNG